MGRYLFAIAPFPARRRCWLPAAELTGTSLRPRQYYRAGALRGPRAALTPPWGGSILPRLLPGAPSGPTFLARGILPGANSSETNALPVVYWPGRRFGGFRVWLRRAKRLGAGGVRRRCAC